MRSDLYSLVTAQEAFHADSSRYDTSLAALNFTVSHNVVISVIAADSTGWAARARFLPGVEGGTTTSCAVYVGTARPPEPGMSAGVPSCVPGRGR
jgi:energy-converting hydrogenase Eha subunit B